MKLKTVLMAAVFALTLAARAGDVSFTEYTTIPDNGSSGANNAVILPIQWKDIRKIYVKYAYATAPSQYPILFATSSDNVGASSRGDPRIGIKNASTIDKSGLSSFVFTATPGDTYGAGATVHEATMTFTSSSANYFLFGCAWSSQAYCATIDWYAVKLYDSSDTLLANMIPAIKDDVVGFYDSVSGNFYDRANSSWPTLVAGPAKHAVTVAGAPHELGSPNPGYGERGGQTVGSSVTFTCPSAATNAAGTISGTCAGWTLKKLDGTTTSGSGTSTTFTYDDSFCLSTLTWRWNVRYAVDVRTIVNGKLVGTTRGWTETDGSITLACPDVPAGCEFAGWYGSSVSSDVRYEPSLSLTMSAPGTVYAVFRTTGAANKLCLVDYATGADDAERDGGTLATAWKTFAYAVSRVADGDVLVLLKGRHDVASAVTVSKEISVLGDGVNDETVLDAANNACAVTVATSGVNFAFLTFQRFGTAYSYPMVFHVKNDAVFSNIVVRACGNSQTSGGGNSAHQIIATAGLFTHCFFTNNCVPMSYLLDLSGTAAVEDCYIGGNTTRSSGTIGIVSLGSADNVLKNCTIVDNTPVNVGAVRLGVAAKVYNNIVWGNVDQATGVGRNWSADASHTANWLSNCTTPTNGLSGAGNVVDDPLLKDDRMHFKSTSPCRGKANTTYATATDLDGTPRGATPSIGAFEYVDSGELELALGSSATFARLPGGITLTASITGAYAEPLTYSWSFKGDGHEDSTAAAPTIETVGTFRPSLTVTDANGKTASASFEENLTVHAAGATTYYVDYANGDNGNDGFARSSAWKTLQHAVTRDLVADGDTVVLLRGTHVVPAAFSIDKAITVRGEGAAGETVLTDNDTGGTTITVTANARFESLTFHAYGGNYTNPMVLSLNSTAKDAVISNVVFRNIGVKNPSGGGNSAHQIIASAGLFTHCTFTNNCVPMSYLLDLGGTAMVIDSLIARNTTRDSSTVGIVSLGSANNVLRNCTIVDNTPVNIGAVRMCATATVCNNIVWGNVDQGTKTDVRNWSASASHVVNWIANCTSPVLGLPEDAKNIEADPQLSAKKPYHLEKTSPCRNGGEDSYVTPGETDLDGKMRKIGRHVDMGCYEQDGPGLMLIVR